MDSGLPSTGSDSEHIDQLEQGWKNQSPEQTGDRFPDLRSGADLFGDGMLRVWGTLSERDKARVYMHALEYRDATPAIQVVQAVQPTAPVTAPVSFPKVDPEA